MAERGISIDHTTINRWVVHFSPLLLKRFNRRKRPVTGKWHADETYVKVRGQWMYLYRAIDSLGDTVEFWFSEHRDLMAAKRFFRKALARHGRPERIVRTGSSWPEGECGSTGREPRRILASAVSFRNSVSGIGWAELLSSTTDRLIPDRVPRSSSISSTRCE
jgi:transposase-like protein